jgi:hypothetical protein
MHGIGQPDVISPDDVQTSFELDTMHIHVDLDIRVQMLTMAATYDVTDRFDIGLLNFTPHLNLGFEWNVDRGSVRTRSFARCSQ